MRHAFISFIVLAAVPLASLAAEKDTQAATATRKKLQVKVTVDFKDEPFEEILKELKKQIEDAGAGSLSWTKEAGVSGNTKYTFAAKDKTVAEVLDGVLKTNSLGYIVIVKQGDRYDGWLKLKQGTERGYAPGDEPKGTKAATKSTSTASKEKGKEEPKVDEADKKEKAAAGKLDLARDLLKDGKKDKAKQRFEDIIRDYPNTRAAAEAKKELEKLGK